VNFEKLFHSLWGKKIRQEFIHRKSFHIPQPPVDKILISVILGKRQRVEGSSHKRNAWILRLRFTPLKMTTQSGIFN
jgi:hypothetical protein